MQSELINNRNRAKQLLAFDGLVFGKCRPTDIDFSMDFQGAVFVFGEIKGGSLGLTMGQKIHLQGLVKSINSGGKQAYAFLAHHNQSDTDKDVHVGACLVRSVYDGVAWQPYEGSVAALVGDIHADHLEAKKK